MTTGTLTLAAFLLERIAEDEEGARLELAMEPGRTFLAQQWHDIMRRVLAECEAKRRIVEIHVVGDPDEWAPEQWACRLCQWDEDCDSPKQDHQYGAGRFPCATLRTLAAIYADHPDYDESWRP